MNEIMTTPEVLSLYFPGECTLLDKMTLTRGEEDFREVYIAEDSSRKIVIKHTSNPFTDPRRIEGYRALSQAYRAVGVYCPDHVPNRHGDITYEYTVNGRAYQIYAEEFAIYPTGEQIGEKNYTGGDGVPLYYPGVFAALGKIGALHLDFMDWPSVYCLLVPHSPPDTTDEQTECTLLFLDFAKANLPDFRREIEEIEAIFTETKAALSETYLALPTSCFQGDINESNVLLHEDGSFAGLIDFNLCGRETVVNYAVRESLWAANLWDNEPEIPPAEYGSAAYEEWDRRRLLQFRKNFAAVAEQYAFSPEKRAAIPLLFHYMNGIWWEDVRKIKEIKDDARKVKDYFTWLKWRMTAEFDRYFPEI